MARPPKDPIPPLSELVERLDDQLVRVLLLIAAEAHDDVARSLRRVAAGVGEQIALLRTEVDETLRSRRHLSYSASNGFARDADPTVDALEAAARAEPSRELVELLERAAGHLVKVTMHADDSNGSIGDLARRVLEAHVVACDAGGADPVRLAKWMVRFQFDDQDFFAVDPVRYASALGAKGLAAYRAAVRRRLDAQRVANVEQDEWSRESFALRYTRERLAVLDRDVEQIVQLFGGELTAPHQFIKVAEAMLEVERVDDALAWARRGIAETSGWQVAKLYDLAANVLADRGDASSVFELRREEHRRMASSSTYARLLSAASALDRWADEIADARAVLAARDRGGFIDALLMDGADDEAWDAALATDASAVGPRRWESLAEAREATDPAGALRVWLRLADDSLIDADRGAYQAAVRYLKHGQRAARSAAQSELFAAHVAQLRDQHRRRPTFISILDKAKLG